MNEQQLSAVNQGKMADVIIREIEPYFERQTMEIIAKLKSEYRSGSSSMPSLLSKVGELCALEDLKNRLKQDSKKGLRNMEEMNDH